MPAGPIGGIGVLPASGVVATLPPSLYAPPLILGEFEPAEAWVSGVDETVVVHGGVPSRRLDLGPGHGATQRNFSPVVDVRGTTRLSIWTLLHNNTPGNWSAHLNVTLFDDLFNQAFAQFPLAFNYQDGVDVWIERTVDIDWFPLDPQRLAIVILQISPVSFGGGFAYIDDFTAGPTDAIAISTGPEFADDFSTGAVSLDWTDYSLGKTTANPRETPTTSPNVVIIDAPDRPGEKCWQLTIQPDDWTTL